LNTEEPTVLTHAALKMKKESMREIQEWIDSFLLEVQRVDAFYAKNL